MLKQLSELRNRYKTRHPISDDEYSQKKEELSEVEFADQYERIERDGNGGYIRQAYRKTLEVSDAEISMLLEYDQLKDLKSIDASLRIIKGCLIFFVVVSVVGALAFFLL